MSSVQLNQIKVQIFLKNLLFGSYSLLVRKFGNDGAINDLDRAYGAHYFLNSLPNSS